MAASRKIHRSDPPRTLLVLKPSSFGDIVHTLPAVSRLKAAWPDCRISWLANTEWMPLLAGNPDVDEVIEFPRRGFRGFVGWRELGKWLRTTVAGRRPDLALDFQGLLRTALIGRLSGARTLAGLREAREGAPWFYDDSVATPTNAVHAVDRYLTLADFALKESSESVHRSRDSGVQFPLPVGEPHPIANELNDGFVLLHPFARGEGKSLHKNYLQLLLRKLHPRRIVLIGRRDARVSGPFDGCIDLLGQTTLLQLIWLIRRASFVISVDSGPAHLAAALHRPMVAIHAWSDPRKVGPYLPDAWVWKNGHLVRVRDFASMGSHFFEANPLDLSEAGIEGICRLATSP